MHMKGRLHISCVRSAMIYGRETWSVEDDDVERLVHAKKSMVKWMCNSTMRDNLTSK